MKEQSLKHGHEVLPRLHIISLGLLGWLTSPPQPYDLRTDDACTVAY